jgi:Mg/Co/Ni transporter MgtE
MRNGKVHEITRAFLETHPGEAARALEHVPAPSCAALLNAVPLKLATDVLRHMLPAHAARCLEHLKPQAVVGLLRALTPQTGAGLLRYLPEEGRDAILGELPPGIALGLRLLLSYPDDAVGAWTDTRVPAFASDATTREAVERVRRSHHEAANYVYVVDADHRFRGVVGLPAALRAAPRAALGELMRPADALSARAPLSAARAHEGWREFHSLPVVDHEGRFVGALHYGALDRALSGRRRPEPMEVATDTVSGLVNAYWLGLAGLVRAAVPFITGRRGLP